MRLLVFGRGGQVARELSRQAPKAVFLGRTEADLMQPGAAAEAIAAHRPEAVINAAAWTAVDAAEAEKAAAQRLNAEVPGEMARSCAAAGIPFLHISTDYVFDGSGTRPWRPEDRPVPLGVYGRTKLAGERAVAGAGGRYVLLRTSWVFSAHGTNFVKTMLRLGAERGALRVVADQVGGPTPAADIAAALVALAGRMTSDPTASPGVLHFAGAPNVSWAGFAAAIMDRAYLACRIEEISTADYPTPAPRPLNSRLDNAGLAVWSLAPPDWRAGLDAVLTELGARKETR